MKNIYFFIAIFFITGCSKDLLKRYEKRIVGSWSITDVKRTGIGGSAVDLPFKEGAQIDFFEDHTLIYRSPAGEIYEGNWDIQKEYNDEDDIDRGLQLTAVDFGNQKVITEYYNDMNFRGSDHFIAFVNSGIQSYSTHFRRR